MELEDRTTSEPRPEGRMLFLGVSTSGSSIFGLFPRWAEILGIRANVEGRDLPLGAPPEAYVRFVREVRDDPGVAGALVTSHKVGVFRYAGHLFDQLDADARLCGEVSCISRRDGALVGHAKDPLTAGRALEEMLGPGYFRGRPAQAVCLGAGGAGTAIVVSLLRRPDPPARIALADRSPDRLEAVAALCQRLGALGVGASGVEPVLVRTPEDADRLLEAPPGSLVVNATGAGKDLPGSPLSARAVFPREAVVWDLNYRGELGFLRQARAQAAERGLRLHDGWRYFLHGWAEIVAEVYHLTLTPPLFDRLAAAAEPLRPPTPAWP
ncbi:MAG TPA: shikimate dehydrogenase [Actinomycetota bacterium]|nr:shikimate dehydrogenase [Actinomycetota bacterium]